VNSLSFAPVLPPPLPPQAARSAELATTMASIERYLPRCRIAMINSSHEVRLGV
jgi:hypothetical protein